MRASNVRTYAAAAAVPAMIVVLAHLAYVWQQHPSSADRQTAAFGHGIGLGLESPWITEGNPTVLEANMVLAVETLVGREDVGAAGFEQNVLVTEDGHEVLTAACPTRWWD